RRRDEAPSYVSLYLDAAMRRTPNGALRTRAFAGGLRGRRVIQQGGEGRGGRGRGPFVEAPQRAARPVLEAQAERGELVADRIGDGPLLRGTGGRARGDQARHE